MEVADVTDVQVKETELAQIVKQIYTRSLSTTESEEPEEDAS